MRNGVRVSFLDRRWFAIVLIGMWAVAYLPHLGTRDLRLEEGRRATVAREMLASGDFVRPTLYGDTYLHKPPLFPWLLPPPRGPPRGGGPPAPPPPHPPAPPRRPPPG